MYQNGICKNFSSGWDLFLLAASSAMGADFQRDLEILQTMRTYFFRAWKTFGETALGSKISSKRSQICKVENQSGRNLRKEVCRFETTLSFSHFSTFFHLPVGARTGGYHGGDF